MSRISGTADQPAPGRVDRRVRRTRHALRHALMELVLEKGYDTVTVEEIIDRADVGRSTFYAHFRDKEDLFLSSFEDEIRDAFRSARPSAEAGQPLRLAPSLWLFRHAARHRDLYRALARRRGGWPLVRRRLEETLTEIFEGRLRDSSAKQEVPVEAAARFVVGALLGLLTWWLDQEAPADPDALDKIFRTLVSGGTRAALGTEP